MTTRDHRDAQLEQWLERSTTAAGEVMPDCVDAETMAAWVDGGLKGAALMRVQDHVADCARCQAVAAALGRTETVPQTLPGERPEGWWRRWMAWAVPLTAGATAVVALAVWVRTPTTSQPAPTTAVSGGENRPAEAPAQALSAPAMPTTAPLAPRPAPETSAQSDERASKPARVAPAPATRAVDAPRGEKIGGADGTRQKTAAAPAAPPAALADTARADTTAIAAEADAPQAANASPALRGAIESPQTQARAAAPSPAPSVSAAARTSAPTVASRAESVGSGVNGTANVGEWTVIALPATGPRWRVNGARVESSADQGRTWRAAATSGAAQIRAFAAVSPSTCWLVGQGGLVLLTTDGVAWSRLAFPTATDLAGVTAADAQTAYVTTVSGLRFSTADGGRTWTRQ